MPLVGKKEDDTYESIEFMKQKSGGKWKWGACNPEGDTGGRNIKFYVMRDPEIL